MSSIQIHPLKLRFSNAYLILGAHPILIDSGSPGDCAAIRSGLKTFGVSVSDLALIAHTHIHSDHMGNTAELATEAGCPVAYHPADAPIVERGDNGFLKCVGLRGRIMSRFFSHAKFDAVKANMDLLDSMALCAVTPGLTVVHTPGHTPGSVSFVSPEGDAIVGDLLMGGYMGGKFLSGSPNDHYFADDLAQTRRSLNAILSKTKRTLYVGHGGPLFHESVLQWHKRTADHR